MDIEMPVMDGLTCTRRIRELERSGEVVEHIPILAVSANARSEQVRQAIDAGIDNSIAKPFRIPELLLKIQLVVKR
jgi:CheY-like chemotaxis protein